MPELFIRCPTCKGISREQDYSLSWGYHVSELQIMTSVCKTCERGFVRYGQEPGHQHQWVYPIGYDPTFMGIHELTSIPRIDIVCACGKSAAEVTLPNIRDAVV